MTKLANDTTETISNLRFEFLNLMRNKLDPNIDENTLLDIVDTMLKEGFADYLKNEENTTN